MKAINIAFRDLGKLDRTKLKLSADSAHTMLVPAAASALEVARQMDATKACLALVVGENGIVGVVAPNWIRNQLLRIKGIGGPTLSDCLRRFSTDPAEAQRDFEHEWLNVERPDLHYCPIGQHYTDPPVCAKHGV